jgi:hypothetical protein
MQKIPIGRSDFQILIEDKCYYVDKTLIIKEVIQNNANVILLPRPRRFGKTLALTTLKYFFANNEDNKHLFKDLAIFQTKEFTEHCGQYPVIYLTFKDIKGANIDAALPKIYSLIRSEFGRHKQAISKIIAKVNDEDKLTYKNIITKKATPDNYGNSLKLLSKLLTMAYQKKCIVLIDEYDTPIQTGFIEGYYEEIINFFKTFLGAVLKDNEQHLYKAVITGILRISKESIFSDLNNIDVFTLLDNEFSDKFGFTIPEVKQILTAYNLIENFAEVDDWYDGYKIGDTIIFNPWSILNYINRRRFDVYWANTSSNDIIKTLVENSTTFRNDLQILLNKGSIEKVIDPNITFKNKDFNFDDKMLYSFLFFSGYLRCNGKRFVRGKHLCQLSIVNMECQYIFEDSIVGWLDAGFTNVKLKLMLKSLIEVDLKLFEKILSEFVRDTLSYFDTAKKVESVYHAFLLGLLVNLYDYEIISNQECGYGRSDIMILHKENKTLPAIVMELKTIDEFEEETKDSALDSAITQIEDRQYAAKIEQRGYTNIVKFGVVFDGKRVWIKSSE